jgi:hypothetical protein
MLNLINLTRINLTRVEPHQPSSQLEAFSRAVVCLLACERQTPPWLAAEATGAGGRRAAGAVRY